MIATVPTTTITANTAKKAIMVVHILSSFVFSPVAPSFDCYGSDESVDEGTNVGTDQLIVNLRALVRSNVVVWKDEHT